MIERTDAQLLTAIATSDRDALRQLHDRHAPWMSRRLRRRCSDPDAVAEAVQDTFVAVWKSAGRWDGRGEPAAWIWGIAIRRLIGVMRTRHRWDRDRTYRDGTASEMVVAAEDAVLLGVEHGDLAVALGALSPELRAVVQATVLDGLTTREAVELVADPVGHRQDPNDESTQTTPGSTGMTNTDWHASEGILTQFADDPAGVDEVRAASLEAHLITCSHCRNQLSQLVGGSFIDDSWARVADQIDRVRPSPWEWAMQCVGVPESWARLLSATPGLQASWVAGLLAVLIAIVAGARVAESAGVFLVAAPLVPMIVEAVAFVPTSDPAGEAGVATPMHGLALALRRTLVVSTAAFVVLAVAQVAVGAIGVPVMAWVLPAMALAAGVLALGTWFRIEVAVGVLAGLWVMVVTSVRWIDDAHAALADSVTFAAPGRWAALVLLLAAVAVIARHQDRFETLEVFR